jgi:hypothetical protein
MRSKRRKAMTWKIDYLCNGSPAKGHSRKHFYNWERYVSAEFPDLFKFVRIPPTFDEVLATGFCRRDRSNEFHLSITDAVAVRKV